MRNEVSKGKNLNRMKTGFGTKNFNMGGQSFTLKHKISNKNNSALYFNLYV